MNICCPAVVPPEEAAESGVSAGDLSFCGRFEKFTVKNTRPQALIFKCVCCHELPLCSCFPSFHRPCAEWFWNIILRMSEITIFFDIYAKFRCILIPVMIYMIVLFPSRNVTGGGSGNSGGTIKILLQKLNLREKSPRTHTMYRWLAKICERTQCFCKITISCRMILKRRTFEIGMSKTTIFFEFYTKFKHIFIPEVISWHYLVFPPEYLWKRQVREFWWDNQNLTPEMKSARKITQIRTACV